MKIPIESLTPKQIVAELDRYIVGQPDAKKAVAVAIRNRYRRQQINEAQRDDILPKNILMIGPTGVGKTEIARRVAQLVHAPFIKVEATKFTEVGYVGRDVESIIRDLTAVAVRLVEKEKIEAIRPEAEKRAIETLVELLDVEPEPIKSKNTEDTESPFTNPLVRQALELFGQKFEDVKPQKENNQVVDEDLEDEEVENEEDFEKAESDRLKRHKKLFKEILIGKHDKKEVEIDVDENSSPFLQVFTAQGIEEMGIDGLGGAGPFSFSKKSHRKMTVADAKILLTDQEAKKLLDQASIHREAVLRTEQSSIVFLDELDKIATNRTGSSSPDVSREGVQRDLLPIIEGSTVATKYGPVKTDHILFITAGAFHTSKPSDLIPELQGRLPIRVELKSLSEEDFRRILSEPKNALLKQYKMLLGVESVELEYTDEAVDEIARYAQEVNTRTENIGARRLHTLLEKILEDLLFEAPDIDNKKVLIDAEFVKEKLECLVKDADLSRYIL